MPGTPTPRRSEPVAGDSTDRVVVLPEATHRGRFHTALVVRAIEGGPERTDVWVHGHWCVTLGEEGARITGEIRLLEPRPDDLDRPLHRFTLELPTSVWVPANGDSFANTATVDGVRLDLLATPERSCKELTLYADVTGSSEGWDWLEVR